MALAYAASVVMFFVFARYRYPLVPFLTAVCRRTLRFDVRASTSRSAFTQGSRRRQLAAVAIAVAVFANWPLLSPTLMRAITENNLGTALQEQGRYDEAIAHHRARDRARARLRAGLQQPRRGAARGRPARRGGRALSAGARAQARLRQRQLQPRQRAARAGQGRRLGRAASARRSQSKPELGRGAQQPRHRAGQPAATRPARSPSSAPRSRSTIARCTRTAISATCWSTPGSAPRAWRTSSARSQLAPTEPEARLRHRQHPAAGSELRRRGGALRGGADDQPGLGRGAQQPRHRAGVAGPHRRRARPTSSAPSRSSPIFADARANRDQARAALRSTATAKWRPISADLSRAKKGASPLRTRPG